MSVTAGTTHLASDVAKTFRRRAEERAPTRAVALRVRTSTSAAGRDREGKSMGGWDVDWINLTFLVVTVVGMVVGVRRHQAARLENEREAVEKKFENERTERNVQIGLAIGEAREAKDRLHAYQLQAAKTFATKEGVTQAVDRMTKAIEGLGSNVDRKLDSMTERLDRVIDGRPLPRGGQD